MKVLAVGDIHAKHWIIDKVESIVNKYDKIVFIGDYVDNWNTPAEESLITLKKLKSLCNNYPDKIYPILGNHDFPYINSIYANTSHGFQIDLRMMLLFPENKDLYDWYKSLELEYIIDGVGYTHAGMVEGWNGDIWSDNSPLWARPNNSIYVDYPQVIGHTPSKFIYEPQTNIWIIDTFSEYMDNTPFGEQAVLEIINGKVFNKIKL